MSMRELPVSCGSPPAVCQAARRADKTAGVKKHVAVRHISADCVRTIYALSGAAADLVDPRTNGDATRLSRQKPRRNTARWRSVGIEALSVDRLAEAPSGCPVAQEHDAGTEGLALHQAQARDLGRVREQPLAAPEHDWIGESRHSSTSPAAISSRTSLMLPVFTMSD